MHQILMQEQQSFEHKMGNIQSTNSILDQLQRKMQSYFNKPIEPISRTNLVPNQQSQFMFKHEEQQVKQSLQNGKHKEGDTQQNEQKFGKSRDRQNHSGQQLEFKLYNQFAPRNIEKRQLPFNNEEKQDNFTIDFIRHTVNRKDQKQRLSQTLAYKKGVEQNEEKNSKPNLLNVKNRKSNQNFRLIGKSKEGTKNQNTRSPDIENTQQNEQIDNKKTVMISQARHKNIESSKINNSNMTSQKKYTGVLHSMETVQLVMKEAIEAKLRNIKHIQQQIMTQNQERVYLYKVNVQLNQQLKHLEEQQNSMHVANLQNMQWEIRKLQDDIDKIKKELQRKTSERKQLRKQEKTLKDGYQTVLNNKKNILRKDIELYVVQQNKTKENTQMLRGLMKELDKLKGVVQNKIKSSTVNNVTKRKVVKSFKN